MTSSLVADGIKIVRGNRVIINNFSAKLRSSDTVVIIGETPSRSEPHTQTS